MTDIDETVSAGHRRVSPSVRLLAVFSVVVLTGVLSQMPVDAAAPEQNPTETIKGTVTELFSILHELKDPHRSEARRREIEQVIRHHAHYEDMAKRSLGASWAQMEEGARLEYVALFVELLRDALANRMTRYDGERIRYLSERRESGFAEVKTRLEGNKVDTALDFRLLRQEGRWLVYDVVIDGVSLVGSYRAQFARIIREASCGQLMEQIKKQTLLVKWFDNGP